MDVKAWLREHSTRQAIQTVYFGPTNMKGARVRAQAGAGTVWHSWDHALDIEENHLAAAWKFATKYNWHEKNDIVAGGQLRDGSYVWTMGVVKNV